MADFLNDAELGPEFTTEGLQRILAVPPRRVLLTGATGFLGAYLVSALIHQGVEEIWCLVRAKDEQDARARLENNPRQHGLWEDSLRAKVRPLAGDLAAPSLGLDDETFRQLGNILEAIVHSGALVNFVSGYDALKPANVGGTREVLRLATQARIVPVHYISTLSVFPSDPTSPVALEVPLDVQPANLKSGYAQSKWVAERLVEQAGKRGLPVWIYRPGRITGESHKGRWSTDDLICRIIRACVEIKAAPEMDAIVDMTPVDYVSGVIARSLAGGCAQGCYHLVNPRPAPVSRLTDGLRALGYRLDQVSLAEWTARLDSLVRGRTDHSYFGLSPLLNEWESTMRPHPSGATRYDSTQARSLFEPYGLNCPPADLTLVRTYVKWLIDQSALPAPEYANEQI
jgi:thioester reductase-like protein